VRDGYAQQLPLRPTSGGEVAPFLEVDEAAIVVESVKAAEDRSGDVVVRLYEAHGTRARGVLRTGFPWTTVTETDLLERATHHGAVVAVDDDAVRLELRPFQVVTLRIRPRRPG
jgi:alpha-mannosidase